MNWKLVTFGTVLILSTMLALLLAAMGALWLLAEEPPPEGAAIRIAPAAPLTSPTPTAPATTASPSPTAAPTRESAAPVPPSAPIKVTSPPAAAPATAAASAQLDIPRLELERAVLVAPVSGQSWQVAQLQQAIGHLAGTAAFGAAGNVVLAGHVSMADGSPGPFARLSQLSPGDEVWLRQDGRAFKYVVDGRQVVPPTAIEVTYPTDTARLTLITCDGWNEADSAYTSRLVVTGFLADD